MFLPHVASFFLFQVLSIADIFKPPSKAEFEDLLVIYFILFYFFCYFFFNFIFFRYIVSDLMDTDLEVIINSGQPLSETHIQYFTYQLLCAVKYIHSANVLHRDIKPANILCNEDCTIKVFLIILISVIIFFLIERLFYYS